jgi:hypothetical protein
MLYSVDLDTVYHERETQGVDRVPYHAYVSKGHLGFNWTLRPYCGVTKWACHLPKIVAINKGAMF